MGLGSRAPGTFAVVRPHFRNRLTRAPPEGVAPVADGVPMGEAAGAAIGASGDTSDNDEAALMKALAAAGLSA